MAEKEMTDEQRSAMAEKLRSMTPEQLAALQKEQCIFCKIVSGQIPSKKIYEDQIMIAILDINPAARGHLLLIPKNHYMIMPHVPDGEMAHLFVVAQKLSECVLRTLKVGGTSLFIANGQVAGQRAQHVILHVIPRKEGDKVLEFTDTLISSEMVSKVETAVKPTFFKHLGLGGDEPKNDGGNSEEKKDSGSTGVVHAALEPDAPHPEPSAYKEHSASGAVRDEGVVKKSAKKVVASKGIPVVSQDEKVVPKRKDDDVSLDDIANLFK